jgi:hypothetical protein
MATDSKSEQSKPSTPPPSSSSSPSASPQPRQGNSGQDSEPGEGLKEAVQAAHKARTEVPGAPGVDARLDNRSGAQRPPLEEWPAKPQQIDGPDLEHQAEHTRKTLDRIEQEVGERKGMYSPGPHGLSDESQRGGQAVEGREGWKD